MYERKCMICKHKYPVLEMLVVYRSKTPQTICNLCYKSIYGMDERYVKWGLKEQKTCEQCGNTYPETEAYFHWYNGKSNKYCRKCCAANKAVYNSKRRAVKKESKAPLKNYQWMNTVEYFNSECAYCGFKEKITQDHIIPLSRGGNHEKKNVIPCCHKCNIRKGVSDMETWYKKQIFFKQDRLQKIKDWQLEADKIFIK